MLRQFVLLRTVEQLCEDLNIIVQPLVDSALDWHWLSEGAEDIDFALMKRLLLLPEIDWIIGVAYGT